MSLREPADGILETHVTWETVIHEINKAFSTNVQIGEKKSVRNLADGVGFCSMIALIEPDWQGTSEEIEKLPQKFVMKLPTCLNGRKMTDQIVTPEGVDKDTIMQVWEDLLKKFHNAELAFYNYITKQTAGDNTKLRLPKIFASKKFDNDTVLDAYIMMEFVDEIKTMHMYDRATPEQMEEALDALAHIQALTHNDEFRQLEESQINVFNLMYSQMLQYSQIKAFLDTLLETDDEDCRRAVDKFSEIGEQIYDFGYLETELQRRGMACPMFAHGDLWAANLMWNNSGSLRCIVDFQVIHLGTPAEDITRLLQTCMSGEDRRKHEFDLLDKYHDRLSHYLDNKSVPFTKQQLHDNYISLFPFSALLNACMFGPVVKYATMQITDPEASAKASLVCQEKVQTMFEDALKFYEQRSSINKVAN